MNFKIIAEREFILPYNQNKIKKGRVKSYSVGSEWTFAEPNHPQINNYEVVIVNHRGKWLGLSKEDLNNHFEILKK